MDGEIELLDLGACCSCGKSEPLDQIQNILMLPWRSPYGYGWGCFQCGLPSEGAIAVLCNDCVGKQGGSEASGIKEFVKGLPLNKERATFSELTEPFDHNLSLHPETQFPTVELEDWDADPFDPVVLVDPLSGETLTDSQLSEICSNVAERAKRGLPVYWRNEVSGELAAAVEAFTQHNAYPNLHPAPTQAQLETFRLYLERHINAGCWDDDSQGTLADLRSTAPQLQTIDQFNDWLDKAFQIGIDPL